MQEIFEKIKQRIRLAETEACGYTPMTRVISEAELKEIIEQAAEEYKECALCYMQTPCEYQNKDCRIPDEKVNNGWIPCSERLPETNESVLCWAKSTARGGDVCFVGSCHNSFWFLQSSADTHSLPGQYVVVAWHPLPDPYQPNICTAADCPINDGKECPAFEGCAGYQPKGE